MGPASCSRCGLWHAGLLLELVGWLREPWLSEDGVLLLELWGPLWALFLACAKRLVWEECHLVAGARARWCLAEAVLPLGRRMAAAGRSWRGAKATRRASAHRPSAENLRTKKKAAAPSQHLSGTGAAGGGHGVGLRRWAGRRDKV